MAYLNDTGLSYLWGKLKPMFAGKLDKSGGTMTGALTLSGAPTSDLHAATKKYVDDNAGGGGGAVTSVNSKTGAVVLDAGDVGAVDKSGDTMTGALTLSGAPTSNLHAATKKYVDDAVPDISGKLDKSGGTMTGALTLSGAPSSNLHAATKKYVDDSIPDITGKLDKSGGTMTGALTLSGAPTSNLHAATKQYVDDVDARLTYGNTDLTDGSSALTTGVFYAYYE